MSIEVAAEGAKRLRPATVAGNQRHAATLLAEQIERDRNRFPIPGLSREAFANLRNSTIAIGEVAGASAAKKGTRNAHVPVAPAVRPAVDSKPTLVTEPTRTADANKPKINAPTRTI